MTLRRVIAGLDRTIGAVRRLSKATVYLSGALLFALCGAIAAEVIARKVFSASFQGVDELAGYTLAIVASFAFTYTLFERAHIRIDVLYARLPGLPRAILDLLALLGLVVFFGTVLYHMGNLFARNLSLGATSMTPLAVPLAIPQSVFVAALSLFVLSAALLTVRAVLSLLAGDRAGAARLVGSRAASDEVEEEVALARRIGTGEAGR